MGGTIGGTRGGRKGIIPGGYRGRGGKGESYGTTTAAE